MLKSSFLLFALLGIILVSGTYAQINVDPVAGNDDTCDPCQTIGGAIKMANSATPTTITLAAGLYTLSQQLNITNPVLLTSTAGPESTTLTCGGGDFLGFRVSAAGSGFSNLQFTNCKQIIVSSVSYKIENVIMIDNNAGDLTLLDAPYTNAVVTITNSRFHNNKGYISMATQVEISHCNFTGHEELVLFTGAVRDSRVQPRSYISDCIFEDIYGAAIFSRYAYVVFDRCVFRNIYGHETVFYMQVIAEIHVANSLLESNYVNNTCALVWSQDSGIFFENSTIRNISSAQYGAICNYNTRTYANIIPYIYFDNCDVYDNYNNIGGVAFATYADVGVYNSRIYNNNATYVGGVFGLTELTLLHIADSEFYGNHATHAGVAYMETGSFFVVERSVFHNNSADGRSGAFRVKSNSVFIDSTFYNNHAGSGPNDIYITDGARLNLTRVTFSYCGNFNNETSIRMEHSTGLNNTIIAKDIILEYFDNSEYKKLVFSNVNSRVCSFPTLGDKGCFDSSLFTPDNSNCGCGTNVCDYTGTSSFNKANVCIQDIEKLEEPIVCPIPTVPTVFGVQPLTTPTIGGVITILGYNFGSDITKISVTVGGLNCENPQFVTVDNSVLPTPGIQCSIGSGTGKDKSIIVTVDGVITHDGNVYFSRSAPSISSYTASVDNYQISINGANFGNDKSVVTVNIGNTIWPVLYVDHTYIIAQDTWGNSTMRRRANVVSGIITVDSLFIQQNFDISGFPAGRPTSTTGGVIPGTTSSSDGNQTPSNNKSNNAGIIAAAIIVPIVVIGAIVGIVVFLKKRRPGTSKNRAYRRDSDMDSFDGGNL